MRQCSLVVYRVGDGVIFEVSPLKCFEQEVMAFSTGSVGEKKAHKTISRRVGSRRRIISLNSGHCPSRRQGTRLSCIVPTTRLESTSTSTCEHELSESRRISPATVPRNNVSSTRNHHFIRRSMYVASRSLRQPCVPIPYTGLRKACRHMSPRAR
jgi:hypothetical protein